MHFLLIRNTTARTRPCLARAAQAATFAVLLGFGGATVAAQDQRRSARNAVTIDGMVRDSAGIAIGNVSVSLRSKEDDGITTVETTGAGEFAVQVAAAGTYSVRVEKPGLRACVVNALEVRANEGMHLDLVLEKSTSRQLTPASCTPGATLAGAMELADEPNFIVAGVTDWSNAGLHGSATTVRASETLTKGAAALKKVGNETGRKNGSDRKLWPPAMTPEELRQVREKIVRELSKRDTADLHRSLADVEERLGYLVKALGEYERAARMDPSEENYLSWGVELLLHRAAQPAVNVFQRGFAAHPGSERMLVGLGAALYVVGSYDEAAKQLCQASDLDPSDADLYLFLGTMEEAATEPMPCADERLSRFAHLQPGNAQANYYYAIALSKRARKSDNATAWNQASSLLDKAVAIDPIFGAAYVQRGLVYAAQGDPAQAKSAYRKAVEVSPNLGIAHYQLSLAYKRSGEDAKARDEMLTYQQIEKSEHAAEEKARHEMRQFIVILKEPKVVSAPR